MNRKLLIGIVCAVFLAWNADVAYPKGGSSGGSSSRSPSSSKSFSSPSRPSSSPSKSFSSSSNPSKSFSSPSSGGSSKKPDGAKSSTSGSKPMFGSQTPSTPKPVTPSKPTFGSQTPNTANSSINKPSGNMSAKARANVQETSRQKTAPPPTRNAPVVAHNPPPQAYKSHDEHRQQTNKYVEVHHYNHNSDWYYRQPNVYVGGGYSSMFWWMMMTEWSAERRAQWLYHNQANIDHNAYMRGLQDAEVRRQVEDMNSRNVERNPKYIDPEVQENPGIMYDVQEDSHSVLWSTVLIISIVMFIVIGYYIVFVKRW